MDFAIKHMNEEHQDANLTIAKYFGKLDNAKVAIIIKIEPKTLHLLIDNETTIAVPFLNEVNESNIKEEIINLLKTAKANMAEEIVSHENLPEEISQHINKFKSVILATANKENHPCASYAPFINFKGKNYIYVSQVAEHYQNLIDNPKIETLFLEDESSSKIITARKRVKFKSIAKKQNRNIADFETIMDKMQEKHGNTVKMTRKMTDFSLFEIEFLEGRYVKGFGQAYTVIPSNDSFKVVAISFDTGMPHAINN
ncbi:MAG: pyridoxamine 5'-phosphate oxidase family protein [Alphaproteobacteria bacterium]|jgi:HugZ family heme oxygenase|nr:pyridoxamine 5'-phosphate oxidase family protein [Alphaproteobacteria bacterium]